MEPIYHSFNLTLDELRDECSAYQAGASAKLIHLQAAEVEVPVNTQKKFNQARYIKKGNLDPEQELMFREIKTDADLAQAASDALAGGFQTPIFNEMVFVSGTAVRVVG
ncbi:MAG: hypothetical protein ABL952_15480, partial [Pyrinomonadaceae bacterium]